MSDDGSGVVLPGGGEDETNPYSSTGNNEMYDQATAESINKAYRERKYKATAVVVGDVNLTSNIVIKLVNVSKKYSGNWWVVAVKHKLDESKGYICELDLQRDAIGTDDLSTDGRTSTPSSAVVENTGTSGVEQNSTTDNATDSGSRSTEVPEDTGYTVNGDTGETTKN